MRSQATHRWTQLGAAVAGALALGHAAAQEGALRYEITPYAAYRVGGEFEPQQAEPKGTARELELEEGNAAGLILDIRTGAGNELAGGNGQWEVLYAHQSTELDTEPSFVGGPTLGLDVTHFQLGGAYLFNGDSATLVPFIAMTAGLARLEPRLDDADAEDFFSWSLGGGVHLRADKRIGVRLEARVFGTLIDDDGALFCVVSPTVNSCAVSVEGDQLYQLETRVGIVGRF
ncbi:MAG TPA: hypothetical protein VFL84_00010 [Gammaproteobacteria bacterium]|nr:hypothetical protein [Gammaproteobacteria bacterium]